MTISMGSKLGSTLQNIVDKTTLKWIFVGGKGGVGKTTTSCSLAIKLSKNDKRVLLISTDPAHNLSDAFDQKFSKDPTPVKSVKNLYAMEIDPSSKFEELTSNEANGMLGMVGDLVSSVPGIDEAMGFAEVMKLVQSMDYDHIVFDTAPTGHTLRFLNFPNVLKKGLSKLKSMLKGMGGMLSTMSELIGGNDINQSDIKDKMNDMIHTIDEVNRQFKDNSLTTFICVCISEFLSLYETERMIQELLEYEIDVSNIVVNQLILESELENGKCNMCKSRRKIQNKYLEQMYQLYSDDFYIIEMPMLKDEVRGAEMLGNFGDMLTGERNKKDNILNLN